MKFQRLMGIALASFMFFSAFNASTAFAERKNGNRKPKERYDRPWSFNELGLLQKPNAIVGPRFAIHDKGLQWLMMANFGELANPDDRPAGPPTPYHPSSSQRDSKLEYPGGTGTRFLFSGGLWVGAKKNDIRIVSTVTDGNDGTGEFGPVSSWQYQSTDNASKENDDDGDWNAATDDRDGNGSASNDWDGPNADANGDGVLNYDPEPHIDEDPIGDMSADFLDNDFDGKIDEADPDLDGDKVPGSLDDDGDGKEDEDTSARGSQEWYTTYVDTCANCISSPDPDGFTPLGVRVVQHSYQWPETFRDDFLILEYFVTNISSTPLNDVWLATFFDFDVQTDAQGRPGSEDDITFFIDSLGTAIGGDDDGEGLEGQFFGVRVLKTPRPNAGFSYLNFSRLTGSGDPNDNLEKYVKMSSGVRDPDQFVNSDWRFLFSFGPLGDVQPGETLPVTLTIVNGGKKGLSLAENRELIAQNSRQALALFQNDFRGPAAPDAPNFTLTPMERAVKITWDKRAENSIDPIAKKLDFEGYRIWRSLDGINFTLIADYDAVNGMGFDRGLPSTNASGQYEYIDNGVQPLVQVKYAVTAYDNGDNGDGINHPENDRAIGGVGVLESSRGITRQKVVVANSASQSVLENVYVVPNPYLGSSEYEQFGRFDASGNRSFPKTMQFVNLPEQATIQIFTLGGDLVQELQHNGTGVEVWNLQSRLRQEIVSGIYLYRVSANGEEKIGKFVVVK